MIATNANFQEVTQGLRKAVSMPAQHASNQNDLVVSLSRQIDTLKKNLIQKAADAGTVSTYLIELTWIDTRNEEVKETIAGLLDASRKWYQLEVQFMKSAQTVVNHGIAEKEFKLYQDAIEDLEEAIADLKSAVFTLPESEDFNDTMKALSDLP